MPFSPIPRGVYPSVTSLDPKKLKEKGITLVLADLDNTLVPYKVLEPSPEVAAWMTALKGEGTCSFCPTAVSPAGLKSLPSRWESPIRDTRASPRKRAT